MKYEISKELFEEVMEAKDDIVFISIYDSEIKYLFDGKTCAYIANNDFFFKCKEWALKQGYDISSQQCLAKLYEDGEFIQGFAPASEQQSVFDACEYILKELL